MSDLRTFHVLSTIRANSPAEARIVALPDDTADLTHVGVDEYQVLDTAVAEVPPEDWHGGEPTNMPADRQLLIEAPDATGDRDLDAAIIQRFADLLPDLVHQLSHDEGFNPGGMAWVFGPVEITWRDNGTYTIGPKA